MGRGSSQSQASSSATSKARPRGTATATADMRRGRTGGSSNATGEFGGDSGGSGSGSNALRFYTDDASGLKISPTVILIMTLCFIGFGTALHVFGKLYCYRSGSAA